jgi:hypothetical protein
MVNFSYPPGILNGQPGAQPQLNMGQPVLSQNVQAKAPALTGNARMSSRMPTIPDNRIGLGEGMLRVGGAMMQGANTGQGYSSAIDAYGNIMDYNRQADMERMQIEQARMLEDQRRQDLMRKLSLGGSSTSTKPGDLGAVADLRVGMAKLQSAKAELEANKNLTGMSPKDIWNRVIGRTVGNKEEAIRLFLQEIRLDSIMRRVAETKGAISNAEMALFGSQTPDVNAQESVWIDWINRQMYMQELLMQRLETGSSVDPNAPIEQTMPGLPPLNTGSTPTETPPSVLDDETNALIEQYAPNIATQ